MMEKESSSYFVQQMLILGCAIILGAGGQSVWVRADVHYYDFVVSFVGTKFRPHCPILFRGKLFPAHFTLTQLFPCWVIFGRPLPLTCISLYTSFINVHISDESMKGFLYLLLAGSYFE